MLSIGLYGNIAMIHATDKQIVDEAIRLLSIGDYPDKGNPYTTPEYQATAKAYCDLQRTYPSNQGKYRRVRRLAEVVRSKMAR